MNVKYGMTVITSYDGGRTYAVELLDVDGNLLAMCNHLSHSRASELAFKDWNHGKVVDLTVF